MGGRYRHLETTDEVVVVRQFLDPPSVVLFFQPKTGDGVEVVCDLEFFLEYYGRMA